MAYILKISSRSYHAANMYWKSIGWYEGDVGLVYVIFFLFSYLVSLGLGYNVLDNVLYRKKRITSHVCGGV